MLARLFTIVALVFGGLVAAVPTPVAYPEPENPDITMQTVPSFMNTTSVYYPQDSDWFTLGVNNVVQWRWAYGTQENIRIVLSNADLTLLATPMVLVNSTPASGFEYETTPLTGPRPGSGYVLTLYTAGTDSVRAVSPQFQIKAAGSKTDSPSPFRVSAASHSAECTWAAIAIAAAAAFLAA